MFGRESESMTNDKLQITPKASPRDEWKMTSELQARRMDERQENCSAGQARSAETSVGTGNAK